MDTLHSIVLGIVQGLSEFLPISSSAHLILVPYFLKWEDPGLSFDVALHMGTLAALLMFFWRDWLAMIHELLSYLSKGRSKTERGDVKTASVWLIILGTIPGAIIGYLLEHKVEEEFRDPRLIGATLAVFGAVLWIADARGRKSRNVTAVTVKDALLVGLAQGLAVIPGVSRSGITITMALALGLTRSAAARFSFLLSAPIIAGAGVLKSKAIFHALAAGGPDAAAVGWGFLASLISGLLAVGFLTRMLKSRGFAPFGIYRIALGLVVIIVVVFS
jgi:undecaprenyl-diphosphatase